MCTSLAQRSLVLCAELVLCWQVVRHNAGSRRLAEEAAVLAEFPGWLKMLETTSLTKSYKMVVLRVLLDAGCFFTGMHLTDLARACRRFLQQHAVLCRDLQGKGHALDHATVDDFAWEAWWNKWPVDRWLSPQAGQTWFECRNQQIRFALPCAEALQTTLEALTAELVDWRLAQYASSRRLDVSTSGEFSFEAKVSHANGKPILFLPDKVKTPDRPVGPTVVQLPDGTEWTFKLVKIACNVAAPRGQKSNQLPDLLRQWFGPHAGLPGTAFQVRFQRQGDSWTIVPLTSTAAMDSTTEPSSNPGLLSEQEHDEIIASSLQMQAEIPVAARYRTHVPVYDLTAAAGGWGPEGSPTELGWIEIPDRRLVPGMFVARVVGRSMEPRIPSGSWCLFRECPGGTRQGRLLLVQCQTTDDPEDGGRYTVKRYASQRRVDEEGNQHTQIALQPLNPAYPSIHLDAATAVDLRIIGEYLTLIPTP